MIVRCKRRGPARRNGFGPPFGSVVPVLFMNVISRVILLTPLVAAASLATSDPLPSWNDGKAKTAILSFVSGVTDEDATTYVPPASRIAVFDNDGTLWAEQPNYFQFLFAINRIKELAALHPEWETEEPFASVMRDDKEGMFAASEEALIEMLLTVHGGMPAREFKKTVADWLASARHPKTGKAYSEMVYKPMLELLAYLRVNEFKTFIVSGGGIDFMRVFVEDVYGIPPEQTIGTRLKAEYEVRDGKPAIVKQRELAFFNDKAGKPVAIHQIIGRRPILAFGNSDGDFQMLEWTTAGDGMRLGMLVHHTDAEREWAYDRDSPIGRLNRGLDEANDRGWVVVDMARDWAKVFPFEE